ncbi:MAG: hypothetical protein ACI81R_000016 [Bradymonadia bacterium]|jgi:hypothetical protein
MTQVGAAKGAEHTIWSVGLALRLARTKEGDRVGRLRPSISVDYMGEISVMFSVAGGVAAASNVPT